MKASRQNSPAMPENGQAKKPGQAHPPREIQSTASAENSEKTDLVAAQILAQYRKAFEELAK